NCRGVLRAEPAQGRGADLRLSVHRQSGIQRRPRTGVDLPRALPRGAVKSGFERAQFQVMSVPISTAHPSCEPLPAFVPMEVMHVGRMGMRMPHWTMFVKMRVRLAWPIIRDVRMTMVLVMNVRMRMRHRFMHVHVLVMFGEM